MHLPKTGGTTVSHYVTERIGQARCCPVKGGGFDDTKFLTQYDFVSGHFNLPVVMAVRAHGYACALQLRDPLERLTSNYNYLRTYTEANPGFKTGTDAWRAQVLSREEFFAVMRGNANFDNVYVRVLAGYHTYGSGAASVHIGQSDYERAIETLNKFDLVGFTTRQRHFVNRILAQLRARPILRIVARNVTARIGGATSWHKDTELVKSSELADVCADFTRYDNMLFDYAKRRFAG